MATNVKPERDFHFVKAVNEAYSAIATAERDNAYSVRVASAFGYTAQDLQDAPAESHMGLACGNPVANASIKEGERILDLGSGGGFDVFLAARRVGSTGQATGLDGSEDMISKARRNVIKQGFSPPQVAFILTQLTEPLPIATGSIDCVLSNCVINLLPPSGKPHIFKEIFRVLKPGGRLALSDIVAKKPLPQDIRDNLALYVGCISGAIELEDYKELLDQAGLKDATFVGAQSDLNIYFAEKSEQPKPSCCATASLPIVKDPKFDANDWASSYHIYAVKASDTITEVTQRPLSALLRWWDAYPPAQSSPEIITPQTLVQMFQSPNLKLGHGYAVIDVRGDDHTGGHVAGSIQCRAQTFYDHLPEFAAKFENIPQVVFYCNRSNGRGPRCAGWYQDYLDAKGVHTSRSYVLQGGIVGWMSDPDTNELVEFDTVSVDESNIQKD